MWRRAVSALRFLVRRRTAEAELDEELRYHVDRETALHESRGLPPAEARRRALAAFGGVDRAREEVRDARGVTPLQDVLRDVKFAGRRIVRSPRHAALVVVTLGLGIGAAATVYSAVDGVLLKPLPYASADRLVTLWQTKPAEGLLQDDAAVANFYDWQQRATSFASLVAANPNGVNLRSEGTTETVEAWSVTPGFFELAGTPPVLGRWFAREDFAAAEAGARSDAAGSGASVVILDHGVWQRRFGGDPSIVGRALNLDGVMHTVVGVMPPGFGLPEPTGFYLPNGFQEDQRTDRFATYIKVLGRLRDGVGIEQAQAEMDAIARDLEREHPRSNSGVEVRVIGLEDFVLGAHRRLLLVLLGAASLLVLVTVANVAALHVTRLARQQREMTVRAALGARGRDMARPVVAEAALLALGGGIVGAAMAVAGVGALRALGPADLPRLDQIAVDGRVGAAVGGLVLLGSILMSTLGLRRANVAAWTGSIGGRSVIGHHATVRLRRGVVAAQLALALVLLVGTSLLVRSFLHVLSSDRGYRTDNLLTFTSWVYDEYPQREALAAFVDRVRERLAAIPGVQSVAVASSLPLADGITGELADIVVEGSAIPEGQEPQARATVASPEYFPTLGIRLIRGRLFDRTDDASGRPVVLVNESFARRFYPGATAIGRTVGVGLMGRAMPREIVGVVGDTRHARLDAPAEAAVFIPWAQRPIAALTFVLGTTVPAASLAAPVKRAMYEVDPRVGVARLTTLDALLAQRLRARQFLVMLLGVFAVVAVAVAVVGVYGVMSQTVIEREREIGLRMALGADGSTVIRQFLGEAAWMTMAGLVAGLLIAGAATRALLGLLYGVSPLDPASVSLACLVVTLLALMAAVVPAWRAVRVSPAHALQVP